MSPGAPALAAEAGTAARRRVLFALPGLHRVRRGAEVALESIADELAASGSWDVTLVGTGDDLPGRRYRYRRVGCVPRERFEAFPRFPPLRSHFEWEELTFVPGLLRELRRERYDLTVGCSYPFTNWALRLRGARRAPPHVYVTENGDWPAYARNREYRWFGCDGLACTNPVYYERNQARWRCALLPNGVDEQAFRPGPRTAASFGVPDGVPVALVVSALVPYKRVVEAIRCAARIPDLHLLVAGDGELRREVDEAGRAQLGARFHRVGVSHDRMPDLYRAADVLLHASLMDPSPLAFAEALATGLPVVTHDNPVTRWTFDGQAVLVDAANDDAVVEGLRRALATRSPEAIASRRALAERRFAWRSVARGYAGFFDEVLAVRAARAL